MVCSVIGSPSLPHIKGRIGSKAYKLHSSPPSSPVFSDVLSAPLVFTALKIKVKEITYINRDTKIILETKSKTIYKLNGVSERDLKKSVLWLKDSLQCTCEEMNDINAPYLVMGQKQGGELVITSVKRWQKGQREFKRISRSIRKLQC
jgi:hypothetical protein